MGFMIYGVWFVVMVYGLWLRLRAEVLGFMVDG